MSRPQKIHPPIKGAFDKILEAIGDGKGLDKRAQHKTASRPSKPPERPLKKR